MVQEGKLTYMVLDHMSMKVAREVAGERRSSRDRSLLRTVGHCAPEDMATGSFLMQCLYVLK